MLARLHNDHIRYFGKDAPWWWCLIARTIGPMPMFWDARQWPPAPADAEVDGIDAAKAVDSN